MIIDFLITNAAQIISFPEGHFSVLENGTIACSGKTIAWVGPHHAIPKTLDIGPHTKTFDAKGLVVLPGLIDSHTHTIFAGSREDEFEQKIKGATYQEIAARGGGIKNTMAKTRDASKEDLLKLGIARVHKAMQFGITTLEMKSGYGLSFEHEIKILEVIRELRAHVPCDISATFLGAHTIPPEFASDRKGYIDLICQTMIPYIAKHQLAEFCDAFCETNVFTPDETRAIFKAAKRHGLKLKLHADQLTNTGGAELCVEMGAISADHLENISDKGLDALSGSNVIAGLLPGCSFFLNMRYPPARRMIDMGIPVALATDFNPGSCPTQNLQLIMSIACTQMRMTPAEALQGVTLNGARSLDRPDIGNIQAGLKADFALFDVPGYNFIPYHFGQNTIHSVIKNGQVLISNRA